MSATDTDTPRPEGPAEQAAGPQWQQAKNKRNFLRVPGVGGWKGLVWQSGAETPEQALARYRAGGADKPPRSKRRRTAEQDKTTKHVPEVPVSRDETTRRIQRMLADLLCMPAIPCGMLGAEWEANHFSVQGDRFAHAIARSSERNPWMRRYLERGLDGEQTVVAVLSSLFLLTGIAGYVGPPLMKWGLIPTPPAAARAFGIPPGPGRPPPPPAPVYTPPPAVEMAEQMAGLWEQAAAMAEQAAAQPVDLADYAAPGEHQPVSQPPEPPHQGVQAPAASALADQV